MSELYQSDYSTPGYLVQAALRGAISQGVDPKSLLKKSGIDPQILNNPHDRIESSQFAFLLRNLWLVLKDEYLGFGPRPSLPGTFATMCQCILPCHNLLHAITVYSKVLLLLPLKLSKMMRPTSNLTLAHLMTLTIF